MTNNTEQGLAVSFTKDRETKNTVRFVEEGRAEDHAIGTLYVQKTALAKLSNPERVWVLVSTNDTGGLVGTD